MERERKRTTQEQGLVVERSLEVVKFNKRRSERVSLSIIKHIKPRANGRN